jgi:hypothetical protein
LDGRVAPGGETHTSLLDAEDARDLHEAVEDALEGPRP